MTTPSPWTTRRNLLLAARKLAVIQYDYSVALISTVHDPATGALTLPNNGRVIGLHDKKVGGKLANAQTINDIRSHGEGTPTRQIPSQRDMSVGLAAQETNRMNLENWYGADLSSVHPDASGGISFAVPELPLNRLSRVILLGKDDFNGEDIFLAWICNRTNINKTDDQNMTDADVAGYPYTMNFQGEDDLEGEPMIVEIFGPGWKAIQDLGTDIGFGS